MTGGADLTRGVRIGTAERESAAVSLGEHFSAGRLTADEYDERVVLAYQARTAADLEPLFADLPSTAQPPQTRGHRFDRRPVLILLLVAACVAWVAVVHIPPFFVFPLVWIFFRARRFAHHHRY